MNPEMQLEVPRLQRTTAKDPDIVDLKQECESIFVDELFLHDANTTKGNSFRFRVKNFSVLSKRLFKRCHSTNDIYLPHLSAR
jgi:hypothetical protein